MALSSPTWTCTLGSVLFPQVWLEPLCKQISIHLVSLHSCLVDWIFCIDIRSFFATLLMIIGLLAILAPVTSPAVLMFLEHSVPYGGGIALPCAGVTQLPGPDVQGRCCSLTVNLYLSWEAARISKVWF